MTTDKLESAISEIEKQRKVFNELEKLGERLKISEKKVAEADAEISSLNGTLSGVNEKFQNYIHEHNTLKETKIDLDSQLIEKSKLIFELEENLVSEKNSKKAVEDRIESTFNTISKLTSQVGEAQLALDQEMSRNSFDLI